MSDNNKNLDIINTALYTNVLFELGLPITFIQDLLSIDEIPSKILECLSDKLKTISIKPEGGIYKTLIQAFISVGITNSYHQRALYDILTKVPSNRIKRIIFDIKSWIDAYPENAILFSEEKFDRIIEKLRLITQPFDFLDFNKKYKQLQRATGLHLEDIDTILDIRPVIEKEDCSIKDFIFNTTLKLFVKSELGKKQVLEIILDEDFLKPFIVKILSLKMKLELIKKELSAKGFNVND